MLRIPHYEKQNGVYIKTMEFFYPLKNLISYTIYPAGHNIYYYEGLLKLEFVNNKTQQIHNLEKKETKEIIATIEKYFEEKEMRNEKISKSLDNINIKLNELMEEIRYIPPNDLIPQGGCEYRKGKEHFEDAEK